MEKYLDDALIEYGKSDIYPFHMPGHKRQPLGEFAPEEIDITEVEGFDDLHHSSGILKEAQERLSGVFGADESFYLVNGSTAGILAAVCGCVKKGGRLLAARNCHKSVYHAAYLAQARLCYLTPAKVKSDFGIFGSISPEEVKEGLKSFPDAQAVVITSPTYDGVASDIRSIADIVHAAGIPLIVDEAHGAHFGFADFFPRKALALGTDICVESLHKTLPAYTQSAAVHLMRTGEGGFRFDEERVRRYLDIFQSSSPSYVLMAGLDRCVRMVKEDEKLYRDPKRRSESLFGRFEERLGEFYLRAEALRRVKVFNSPAEGIYAKDPSRILINAWEAGLSGQGLYDLLLERYHLQLEMAAGSYAVALTSVMDTDEGFSRLFTALSDIDAAAGAKGPIRSAVPDESILYAPKEKVLEIARAADAKTELTPLWDAAGRVSSDFVYLYPPGVPVYVPGEVLTGEVLKELALCGECGMHIRGIAAPHGGRIRVCR